MANRLNYTLEKELLSESVKSQLSRIKKIIPDSVSNLNDGISILKKLRIMEYDYIHQHEHSALVFDAVDWLTKYHESEFKNLEWSWNPQQEFGIMEFHLQGVCNWSVTIEAKVISSTRTITTIKVYLKKILNSFSEDTVSHSRYCLVNNTTMFMHLCNHAFKFKMQVTIVDLKSEEVKVYP